jgi:hypothetical protein
MYEPRYRRCFEPSIPKQAEMDFLKAKTRGTERVKAHHKAPGGHARVET